MKPRKAGPDGTTGPARQRSAAAAGGGVRVFSHTADIGLAARGTTLEDLFTWAGVGLTRAAVRPERGQQDPDAPARRTVPVSVPPAPDPEGLLVGWLNFLIYLLETEGVALVSCRLRVGPGIEATAGWTLTGELDARAVPARGVRTTVKAATYHGLEIAQSAGLYRARVILDV